MPRHIHAVLAAAFALATGFASTHPSVGDVTVHEWGTFTSVAGEGGQAIPWLPLDAPADLPCFVEQAAKASPKAAMAVKVRMETPVLYFYAPRETTVDVRVGFKQGFITEYFPHATLTPRTIVPVTLDDSGFMSSIRWQNVRIQPEAKPEFQVDSEENHYYAARSTDAAPLEVGTDKERFLFYRGAGNFNLPLTATISQGDDVIVRAVGGESIPAMMLFERRGGRTGHRVEIAPATEVRFSRPQLDGDMAATRAALHTMLEAQGLYAREAGAMIETWRDSWFTEGSRLFYVMPRAAVERVLPLRIDPVPARIERVFVGRLELATAATLSEIGNAARTGDRLVMQKYGRFLYPFGDRLLAASAASERARLRAQLESAAPAVVTDASACRGGSNQPPLALNSSELRRSAVALAKAEDPPYFGSRE